METEKVYSSAATDLRKALEEANWWSIVQDEVKEQLTFLLDNLGLLGPPFRQAFTSAFKFENMYRMLSKQANEVNHPSALFGPAMSDECYQSGKESLRTLLHLQDWTDPNEADVQACITICNQLEKIEMLSGTTVFDSLLKRSHENDESDAVDAINSDPIISP